ncbi:MAG: TIM barrel protein [Candidatus Sumerlaeota bacterium]|nr:TIM barrel protein [Candidatus Sumerlaeota bacterium]
MTFAPKSASRREFIAGALGTAAGVCALGALNPSGVFAADAPAKGAAKLRLGLATYQWGMDWDIPTLIANLQKANVLGVELRTSSKYAHGVELEIAAQRRSEVKKQFADSPVKIVSVACGERMDWPEAEKLKASIEASKGYLKLSRDIGSICVRVFPNQFQPNVEHEKTIAQIAKAVNELGSYAADLGQRVDLEAHGPAGELPTMKAVMDQVTQKSVGIRLNCDKRDAEGKGFEANFNLVKNFLAHTIHIHNLKDEKFPYQLQTNLLVKMGWDGWLLMENSEKVPDRIEAMIEQRKIWEGMVEKALKAQS